MRSVTVRPTPVDQALADAGVTAQAVAGSPSRLIKGLAPIHQVTGDGLLSYYTGPARTAAAVIGRSGATVILVGDQISSAVSCLPVEAKTLVMVANPRLAFIRLARSLAASPRSSGIHPTAAIDPQAVLGTDIWVGPHATVGACEIGSGCTIHANVVIAPGCRIGNNVTIQPGAVIGADGCGFERNDLGELERFPHFGTVVIEDDVEIGANACIDRGAMQDTIIRRGSKIDDLVYIAHNTEIGANALVIAQAAICGSARIGEFTWIAPGAIVREWRQVGDGAMIGLGAVVVRNVPAGAVVAGVPARPLRPTVPKRRAPRLRCRRSVRSSGL